MPHWMDTLHRAPHLPDPDRAGVVVSARVVGYTGEGDAVYVCQVRTDTLEHRQQYRVGGRFSLTCPPLARAVGRRP